ncbi:hypothetical protein PF008_g7344 [Phytophthora fragariae]|uniref:Uncharacterized protein n=1 Tax=Phytophthora fragariae TaxID=53985 RepID=A0A6G0S2W0_9STRA|nr:hypothetical protein PF003_g29995 [Phytophthora fragariae]KAE9348437.1 hypothetical protein PF008_g7344 [Phytophthora fragariae]
MAGKIVNAVQKKELDGKSLMELLHQGFEHLSMGRVQTLTNKLNAGV